MKKVKFILFLLFPLMGWGQGSAKPDGSGFIGKNGQFRLKLSFYNHAEWITDGVTTFELTRTSFRIMNTPFGAKKGREIYSIKMDGRALLDTIRKMRWDTLKDSYTNWCVMLTSGNEYVLDIFDSSLKKKMYQHHYYLKQLDEIIHLFNAVIPKEFQLVYLSNSEKQDCQPWKG